ncbi:helix-turn-helix domain-containing protein [Parvularcula maris]|uniref:Helix-turn-helix domain-containing protein n=1 Tax=Parvularcula maris TaxID=2965077 RepID=A0A9X2LBK2_9PROT|nr:helix-turn-helix domain-containing protein [Parvularcula maris]MCQ8186478.1 helix-turn-helix domain-containing protein [Parvularcula maris]
MLLLQAALCFSANTLMLLLAVLFLRDARHLVAARLGAVLFIGSVGYSLNLLSGPLRLPSPLYEAAALANVPTLGLSLLFCRALLLDGFRMDGRAWLALFLTSVLMLLAARPLLGMPTAGQAIANGLLGAAGLAVIAHLLWIAATGYRGDLVDTRRRVRIGVVVFALLNALAVSVVELRGMSVVVEGLVFDTGTLVLCLVILLWILRTEPERFFSLPAEEEHAAPPPAPSPRQHAAQNKLLAAMEEEAAWRDETLTIASLAERIDVPEHQLRALINKGMGHRNFAAFLNGYRLAEAKTRLADPQEAATPILTIAMESGYRTLSTFNRAFKTHEDETPSAFRRRMLQGR